MRSTTRGLCEKLLPFVWLGCSDAIRSSSNLCRAKAIFGMGLRRIRAWPSILCEAGRRCPPCLHNRSPGVSIPERPAHVARYMAIQIPAAQEFLRVLGGTGRGGGAADAADSLTPSSNIRSLRVFPSGTATSIEGNTVQSETGCL